MASIFLALLFVALFCAAAYAVVVLVPSPNPTVANIKNILVVVCAIMFVWWLLGYMGLIGGTHALGLGRTPR